MKAFKLAVVAILIVSAALVLRAQGASDFRHSDRLGKAEEMTFSRDIAPILRARCEECHRSGGIAPMSLVTYEQVRPWARSIKEKVISREMPPYGATGPIGRYQA